MSKPLSPTKRKKLAAALRFAASSLLIDADDDDRWAYRCEQDRDVEGASKMRRVANNRRQHAKLLLEHRDALLKQNRKDGGA